MTIANKKYILGNWKLNKNNKDIVCFFKTFNKKLVKSNRLVYGFAPTHLGLAVAAELIKGQTILMSQDVSDKLQGSFTGQVSCQQLKDLKINYAIVGHSEARQYLGCDDKLVNKKVLTCLANNIHPVICIGESLNQYNKKQTKQVLAKQLKTIFNRVKDANKCLIAYEPLWAIGTGKTPTLKEISDLCHYIRQVMKQLFGNSVAKQLPILYGGSVNENNAPDIITLKDVDGSLIGGASLCPNKFSKIVKDLKLCLEK